MRISLNWLREYVDFKLLPEELAHRLTMVGLEVESIDDLGIKYANFVVGEVLEVGKHPNADKLTVCKVNVGKDVFQIVCGAPNVTASQKVPVGLVGAEVPRDQHNPDGKPFRLSQIKIRGVDSFGMICSAYELDLGDDKNGILVLDEKAKPGLKLSTYFGLDDVIFEIGITPNRPDAMSHIGIAREVAAIVKGKVKFPATHLRESKRSISKFASIRIDDVENCPRYTARVVFGVNVGPSPKWMQDRLNAIGVRPVNNVVDITNYVLMEIGHPLHAFNYDSLENHSVIVKPAKQGEEFITLDHKKRTLSNDTLMICDGKGPVAIAGIMGGADTEISATTSNILLESAYFNPRSIRRSSKNFGLSTDASQRFERGADPAITRWAADRAISLIQEICGGEVLKGAIDVYPGKRTPRKVSLRTKKMNEVLGTSLTPEEIIPLLKSIDIQPSRPNTRKKSDKIDFVIPTFRPDLEREIDLIEEVARRNGYDNIETKTRTALEVSADAPKVEFTDELRNCLVGIGYREAVGNSMQEESIASIATSKFVKIANPISKDMAALRTSLLPGMLQIIRNNIFHSNKNIRLFEIGNVYFDDPSSGKYKYVGNYIEEERVLISISGANIPQNWSKKQRPVDIYDLKGEIESLFQKIFLDKFKFIPYPNTKALTQSGLVIEINREEAGFIGNVSTELLRKYEIDQDVIVCELSIDLLNSNVRRELKYKAAPRYPSVLRDIAFVVDDPLPIEVLGNEIRSVSGSLLTQLDLFDIYTGDQIKGNKKSCAFALEFQAEDHTLSQEEIDQVMQKIIHHISAKFTATIRM